MGTQLGWAKGWEMEKRQQTSPLTARIRLRSRKGKRGPWQQTTGLKIDVSRYPRSRIGGRVDGEELCVCVCVCVLAGGGGGGAGGEVAAWLTRENRYRSAG